MKTTLISSVSHSIWGLKLCLECYSNKSHCGDGLNFGPPVSLDGKLAKSPENTPRNLCKKLETKPTENQNNTNTEIQTNRGAHFLHLVCQGGGAHPCPRQLRHCV